MTMACDECKKVRECAPIGLRLRLCESCTRDLHSELRDAIDTMYKAEKP